MSVSLSSVARRPRRITLHTVTSGDRLIVETVDSDEAERRRLTCNKVTRDIFPPAVVTTTAFVAVEESGVPA